MATGLSGRGGDVQMGQLLFNPHDLNAYQPEVDGAQNDATAMLCA